MDHSPLAKLSLELREQIYLDVFSDLTGDDGELTLDPTDFVSEHQRSFFDDIFSVRPTRLKLRLEPENPTRNELAITKTCRELRSECFTRLFSTSIVCLSLAGYDVDATYGDMRVEDPSSDFLDDVFELLHSWLQTTPSANKVRRLSTISTYRFDTEEPNGSESLLGNWWMRQAKHAARMTQVLPRLQVPIMAKVRNILMTIDNVRRFPLNDRLDAIRIFKDQGDQVTRSLTEHGCWTCRDCDGYWQFVSKVMWLHESLQEAMDVEEDEEEDGTDRESGTDSENEDDDGR